MKNDTLYRISCGSEKLRIYAVECSSSIEALFDLHKANAHTGWLLAESVTAALLLSAGLKADSDQNLTYRLQGNGKISQIIVQCDARGNIRAYISDPQVYAEKGRNHIFSELLGAALINVTKDLGFGDPYTGISPVLYGSVAKDTAYYLTNSEQIPSAVVIGTSFCSDGISGTGGFVIQTYPDTPVSSIENIEKKLLSRKISLSDHLDDGKPVIEYVRNLFTGSKLRILSETQITLNCRCSRGILARTFSGVDNAELQDMIQRDNGAEAVCSFCRKKYRFSAAELQEIIDDKEKSPGWNMTDGNLIN